MNFSFFINVAYIFVCLLPQLTIAGPRDSIGLKHTCWITLGTTLTRSYQEPLRATTMTDIPDRNWTGGVSYFVSKRLGFGLNYIYDRKDELNRNSSSSVSHKSSGLEDRNADINGYVNSTSHGISVSLIYVLPQNKWQFMDVAAFYSVARSQQQMLLNFYTGALPTVTLHNDRTYTYQATGLMLREHVKIFRNFYATTGIHLFTPINPPKPFDDVVRNFYKGYPFVPGFGYKSYPIGAQFGFEYRL